MMREQIKIIPKSKGINRKEQNRQEQQTMGDFKSCEYDRLDDFYMK